MARRLPAQSMGMDTVALHGPQRTL